MKDEVLQMTKSTSPEIETIPLPEGLFRSVCAEFGLAAEGASVEEAEASLRRMIEARGESTGHFGSTAIVATESEAFDPIAEED